MIGIIINVMGKGMIRITDTKFLKGFFKQAPTIGAVKRNKYNAIKRVYDGYRFDSIAEYMHYLFLKDRLHAGQIKDLVIHPKFPIKINGVKVANAILDFQYYDNLLEQNMYVDVKGVDTSTSRLKRKIIEESYNIKITLINKKKKRDCK